MARPSSQALLVAASLSAWALAAPALADSIESTRRAIRNGTDAPQVVPLNEGEQLAIGFLHSPGRPAEPFCTGTLVAPRVVVTAAHCTRGLPPDAIAFGVGADPTAPGGVFSLVQASEFADPDVDAALLFLERDASAAVPGIEPLSVNRAPLDRVDGLPLVGRWVEVAGYGVDSYASSRRRFASVRLVEIDTEFVIVDGEGLRGLCFGDAGAPVLTLNADGAPIVLGVNHGGDDSCVGRDYLTRLDPLGDWLHAAVASFEPLVTAGEPCGSLTSGGRCRGNTVEWCDENGRVAVVDCGAHGRGCGLVDDETGYYCTAADACELDAEGACIDGPEAAGGDTGPRDPDRSALEEAADVQGCGVSGGGSPPAWWWVMPLALGLSRRRARRGSA